TGWPDKAIIERCVRSGGEHVPHPYRRVFVQPLLQKLEPSVLPRNYSDPPRLEAFTGVIYQHDRNYPNAKGYPHAVSLYQLLGVVSDFYQSAVENAQPFLRRTKQGKPDVQLLKGLPPLATFSYSGKTPFTIPADDVHDTIEGSVAIVSFPAAFAQHPILWAFLAHETGGHDVAHAIPGLLDELKAGLDDELAGISVPGL